MNNTIPNVRVAKKLELHYHFSDQTHTMDALVRHKCEGELLAILKLLSEDLGIPLDIETEAYEQGGLRELWSLICENKAATLILTIISQLLLVYATHDTQLTDLQKQDLRLSIVERSINIYKQRNELSLEDVAIEAIVEQAHSIGGDPKFLRHRSNFYSLLKCYPKVTHISTNVLESDNHTNLPPQVVVRSDFDKFIVEPDELAPLVDEKAEIEIISPVLIKGRFSWKGLYKGTKIEFAMKDKEFKDSVISQRLPFRNGSVIDCVLEMTRKVDESGNEQIARYSVIVVMGYRDANITLKTTKGKQYLEKKENEISQLKLF